MSDQINNRTPDRAWPLALAFLALIAIFAREQYLMGSLPIGYDVTTSYLSVLNSHGAPTVTPTSFNLFYLILYWLSHTGLNSLMILKLCGVVLSVATAGAVVWAVKPYLKLTYWQAACLLLIVGLQIGFLRLSWDLYRNTLSLCFASLAAGAAYRGYLPRLRPGWLAAAVLAAAFSFLSHQMVGLLVLVSIMLATVYMAIPKRYPLWRWISVGIATIAAVLIGHSLSAYNLQLVMPQIVPRNEVISLFLICVGYIIPFAIVGLYRLRQPVLWSLAAILLLLSVSPLFFSSSAFLWDRWMYILTIPLIVLAAGGIQMLAGKGRLVKPIWIVCTAILIWPGFQYVVLNHKLANRIDGLYSMFPQQYLWNAVGFEKESDLQNAVTVLKKYDNGKSPILASGQYMGFFPYFAPDLASRLVISSDAKPPWSAPLPSYFLFGINYGRFASDYDLPESNSRQPVRVYHVTLP